MKGSILFYSFLVTPTRLPAPAAGRSGAPAPDDRRRVRAARRASTCRCRLPPPRRATRRGGAVTRIPNTARRTDQSTHSEARTGASEHLFSNGSIHPARPSQPPVPGPRALHAFGPFAPHGPTRAPTAHRAGRACRDRDSLCRHCDRITYKDRLPRVKCTRVT
jgi:hypothetical protein